MNYMHSSYRRVVRLLLLLALQAFVVTETSAQITIGGTVYGGGKEAAINTDNARVGGTSTVPNADQLKGDLEALSVASPTETASEVNIYEGTIGNVFGGGARGRSFGVTKVLLDGANVKVTNNVFGAGEGDGAAVMGGSLVHLKNGRVEGTIYGGADAARTVGQTQVHVQGGSAIKALYAGSRAADIFGNTFAWLDGKNALNNIRVGNLYGGNDVMGDILPASTTTQRYWSWALATNLQKPAAIEIPLATATPDLTYKPGEMLLAGDSDAEKNLNNRNAFVYVSNPEEAGGTGTGKTIEVSSAFVGGNGDYDYASAIVGGQPNPYYGKTKPVLTRGYIQIEGGTYGSLYGGGNAATVKTSTDIFINNKDQLEKYFVKDYMGNLMQDGEGNNIPRTHLFGRVFGGNNKEDMFIRPTWYLQEGSINDLYSGGNAGAMRYYVPPTGTETEGKGGIFLAIESPKMTINNVYGGCRIADVAPITEENYTAAMGKTINDATVETRIRGEVATEMETWLRSTIEEEIANGTLELPAGKTIEQEVADRLALAENQTIFESLVTSRMDNELMAVRYKAVYDIVANTKLAKETMYGYTFQPDYATRVLIKGGTINNVYGGNDVSGLVFNGAQVEIHSSIKNNVYGAGNGDYKYWNNQLAEKAQDTYTGADKLDPDLYFNSTSIFASRRRWVSTNIPNQYDYQRYLQALNLYRPDVKRSYVHLKGEPGDTTRVIDDAGNPVIENGVPKVRILPGTVVGGSVYCGGNSTTLGVLNSFDNEELDVEGHLQIGSYVRAENVFLGSNGENLVIDDMLKHYTSDALSAGSDVHLSLLDPALMQTYMKAVEVPIRCTTGFDATDDSRNLNNQDANYTDFSTWIGSLFVGGNVGSMSYAGQFDVNFSHKIVIYDKVVAGCNKANVPYKEGQNAFFAGGLTTPLAVNAAHPAGTPKVKLNLSGIRLDPYWTAPDGNFKMHYYKDDPNEHMDINHDILTLTTEDELVKKGGNIYGGCYESGHVAGGVEINVNDNVLYEDYEYSGANYNPQSPYDVLSSRLSVFGGGYGLDTEIWGDVTINVRDKGQILKVFGGGEKGIVGKIKRFTAEEWSDADETTVGELRANTNRTDEQETQFQTLLNRMPGRYKYTNAADNILDVETPYNTLVQIVGSSFTDATWKADEYDNNGKRTYARLYDVMRAYGGGYEGHVTGNAIVKLGRAKVHSIFGGACNADIYGYSRIIVGQPWDENGEDDEIPCVTENLYGGNDFGGRILGYQAIGAKPNIDKRDARYFTGIDNTGLDKLSIDETATEKETAPTTVYTQSYVEYHRGKVGGNIFGGASGNYRYLETYRDMFVDDHMLGANSPIKRVDNTPFYAPNMNTDVSSLLTAEEKGVPNWLAVNSFVNVICANNETNDDQNLQRDVILGNNIVSEVDADCDDPDYTTTTTTTTTTTGARLDYKVKTLTAAGGIFGGSEGLAGRLGRADQHASYVRLASFANREQPIAPNVFGAGLCSLTDNSLVDAFSGRYGKIFGGAYGMTLEEKKWVSERAVIVADNYRGKLEVPGMHGASGKKLTDDEKTEMLATYQRTRYAGAVSKVRVHDLQSPKSDIFGAGANAGSMESFVELYAGRVGDVYGASLDQGYTAAATVYIPKGSVTSVNEIFGGAKGKDHKYQCDVSNAFIALRSNTVDVRSGKIFGGNNENRFTRSSFIESDVAPQYTDEEGNLSYLTFFGGGKGEKSVGTFTTVMLNKGAKVKNVYGGSFEGRILSSPALRFYCMEEGERVPWYDPVDKNWKIAEGESRYFDNDVYEYGNRDTVQTIQVPFSESVFDFATFFTEVPEGETLPENPIYDINGKVFKSQSTPVWERFLADVIEKGKVIGVNGTEVTVTDTTELKAYLFEKVPDKIDSRRQYALMWPGYTKYKYSPETRQYHDWTQGLPYGMYREHVFQVERGEPGEKNYVAEKFDYFDYPAYQAKGFTSLSPLYELGQTTFTQNNTKIRIYEGAEVTENVYGAGYGVTSVVAGNTDVRLLGGIVHGNIYGGGQMGHVMPQAFVRVYDNEVQTGHTSVLLTGGSVSKVYGGGLRGNVYGYAETTVGFEDAVNTSSAYQYYSVCEESETTEENGSTVYRPAVYRHGDPCIEQNVYGGGEKGMVDCMANLVINSGHIGYRFDTEQSSENLSDPERRKILESQAATQGSGYENKLIEELAKCYVENVDPERTNDPLAHCGNAFAGGYGEGANTFYTHLWMYGGVVRNSLYGGGEIASVGIGPTNITKPTETESLLEGLQRAAMVGDSIRNEATAATPGYTHVVMVGGEVHGNVFGGGRGYTYDLTSGNQSYGSEAAQIYSDGYVFGNTHVSIRGGVIGTDETLYADDPKGNVFGGGNIGYVFTGAVKKLSAKDAATEGYPYRDQQELLIGGKSASNPDGFEYVEDRYYTNEWLCANCGTIIKCYREPHACWNCQKHSMPSAHADYTSFTKRSTDHLVLTEDCRVVVTPYLRVTHKDGIFFDETTTATDELDSITFKFGEYVPPRYLNTLKNYADASSAAQWDKLKTDGIIIRNAVFAGGNVSRGSSKIYANATTVFGNATATLNDIYYRDFITLGEEGIGGLYGDGNLTFVDGYRELNITNFGTDYDYIATKRDGSISYETYYNFTDREKAYFRVEFKCMKSGGIADYNEGDVIDEATYRQLPQSQRWQNVGGNFTWFWEPVVLGAYEGRMMNTIQRADFCGVFGSRITLMGAEDRVIDHVDPKLYTINRLGELSLNMQRYEKENPALSPYDKLPNGDNQDIHGNYFGIYNVVNYLGGITSDMRMTDKRHTTNDSEIYKGDVRVQENGSSVEKPYGIATYYDWKDANKNNNRIRNNGNSLNKIALANGVYLEVVREPKDKTIEVEQTADKNKDYGYITGIVELDLINVTPGAGGGYVYARNEHGKQLSEDAENFNVHVLSSYNFQARTAQAIEYDTLRFEEFETCGNFVHPTKQILDECWPSPNHYSGSDASNGHYWYIKGNYYVYDQIVPGVAGSVTPSQVSINLPLSITLGSRGRLDLLNVQPNLYAYYQANGVDPLTDGTTLVVGNGNSTSAGLMQTGTPYKLNQPISYWDWSLLTPAEQKCFVPMTYVVVDDFYETDADGNPIVDGEGNRNVYTKGTVYLPSEFEALQTKYVVGVNDVSEAVCRLPQYVRMSNEISHKKGYAVDVAFNNPTAWDNWFSDKYTGEAVGMDHAEHFKKTKKQFDALDADWEQPNYLMGPTYICNEPGVYGQYKYNKGAIITQSQKDKYDAMRAAAGSGFTFSHAQATLEPCYVTTGPIEYTANGTKYSWVTAGVGIPKSQYDAITEIPVDVEDALDEAYFCTSTYLIPNTASDYIFRNQLIGKKRFEELVVPYKEYYNANKANASDADLTDATARQRLLDLYFNPAYYVTSENGYYDGTYFQAGQRYTALDSWCALSDDERGNFSYEYDAFDIISESDTVAADSLNTVDWITYNGTESWPMYPGYQVAGIDHENSVPGYMPYYDGKWFNNRATDPALAPYGQTQRVDYKAYWRGNGDAASDSTIVFTTTDANKEKFATGTNGHISGKVVTIKKGRGDSDYNVLSREEFEAIPNERAHYVAITTTEADKVTPANSGESPYYVKYVVTTQFTLGAEAYPVGRVISMNDYSGLDSIAKASVTEIQFPSAAKYYYCREAYHLGEDFENYMDGNEKKTPEAITSLAMGSNPAVTYGAGDSVPQGTVLNEANYAKVVNLQTNFSILGDAPTETATLYMARESDIDDLSQERIITLVYRYEYDESDESGMNVDHIVERHIINVHLTFLNGEPTVAKLEEPPLVLPNTSISFSEPHVDTGAYEVMGGGFEIYDNIQDAIKHQNGREFSLGGENVYWFQDGNYVSYYAKSYLGKTYSNNVRVKVANYHDIDEVLNDPHYLYIDNPKVHRPSKIYIDDRELTTGKYAGKTELELLPVIFEKSLYKNGTSEFNGHVRNCENLEFVLNSDVAPSKDANGNYNEWTPIGNETDGCFGGNIHGDGHTISGLSASLFGSLCGNVYNLGVTGTFTGSGIADEGYIATGAGANFVKHSGIVSNSWVHTTNSAAKTRRPVYGLSTPNSSLNSLGNKLRLLNCYYPKEDWGDSYTLDFNYNGELYGKPLSSFRNGEVAFNLNGYYLTKRYADVAYKDNPAGSAEYKFIATNPATGDITMGGTEKEPQAVLSKGYYKYLTYKTDGVTPVQDNSNMGYPSYSITLNEEEKFFSYVERRYGDGDFRYRWGAIPSTENVRTIVKHGNTEDDPDTYECYPIWPDDYMFFGQRLTYGYGTDLEREHDALPSAITKSRDGRINYTPAQNNIIFRAPAYYRSGNMNNVFFNAYAVFADHEKELPDAAVHHNLTAVDFTGKNDLQHMQRSVQVLTDGTGNDVDVVVKPGYEGENPVFYPPVLSFTKLTGVETHGLTQNLLFYTPDVDEAPVAPGATEQEEISTGYGSTTFNALKDFVNEPAFAVRNEEHDAANSVGKNSVAMLEAQVVNSVGGHVVIKKAGVAGAEAVYTTKSDHFLVDAQDFNAPIAYTMGAGKRMWYQRWPENYTNKSKGWEAVSLPFVTDIVTTSDKGEITHFYKNGDTFTPGYDTGHEYWLREFTGLGESNEPNVLTASMTYPSAINAGAAKTYENTFLWDYYYSRNRDAEEGQDENGDLYQNGCYNATHTYAGYAYAQAGTPYIVGFPGSTYYEFDLSGLFTPSNTMLADFEDGDGNPALRAQGITFASAEEAVIGMSDDVLKTTKVTQSMAKDGNTYAYTYHANFLNSDVTTDGVSGQSYYLLNQEGSAFLKADAANVAAPASPDRAKLNGLKTKAFRPYFATTDARLKAPATRSIVFGMGGNSQLGDDEPQNSHTDDGLLHIRTKKGRIIVESALTDDLLVRIVAVGGQLYDTYTICPGESVETRVPQGVYLVNKTKVMVK